MKEEKIIAFLKERMISQDEAIEILEKNLPFKNTWKMWRFTLYIWERVNEHNKKGIKNLGTRKEAVERVVRSARYKRLYDTFPLPKFNAETEIKNLTQLIAEPRQDKAFKEGNFKYEYKDKIIPQGQINELR
tara:strand:+ start:137 stop:532 length:396 start_codon:yes stop_codon:yes gene_type:complete